MTVIQLSLFLVIERFPDCRDAFRCLYVKDDGFQSLCENYQQCLAALRYWSRSKGADAAERQREYLKIQRELELEFRDYCRHYCPDGKIPAHQAGDHRNRSTAAQVEGLDPQ